jgi:hypothetical protein
MLDVIRFSGVSGLLILVLIPVLLLVGGLIVGLTRSRGPIVVYAVVCLLPLVIGILGTVAGYRKAQGCVVRGTSEARAQMEYLRHARAQARYTTYMGVMATVVLLPLVVVGFTRTREAVPPPAGGQTER